MKVVISLAKQRRRNTEERLLTEDGDLEIYGHKIPSTYLRSESCSVEKLWTQGGWGKFWGNKDGAERRLCLSAIDEEELFSPAWCEPGLNRRRGWRYTGANKPGRPALIAVALMRERKLMHDDCKF